MQKPYLAFYLTTIDKKMHFVKHTIKLNINKMAEFSTLILTISALLDSASIQNIKYIQVVLRSCLLLVIFIYLQLSKYASMLQY